MTPYYQDSAVTIYHGDCREIMPPLGTRFALLTDPPYGIDVDTDYTKTFGVRQSSQRWERIVGDDQDFDPTLLLAFRSAIIWGANNFPALLPAGGWLIWKKTNPSPLGSECEMAWTNSTRRISLYATSRASLSPATAIHPTQKPIDLMCWCVGFLPFAATILDPFMGSGPTLVAAKNLGRKAIGIEIEERYCEIAARRLAQEVLPFGGGP